MSKIVLKVASSSNPSSVAGALVKNMQEGKDVELLAVGAGAINQAVKAVAIARGYISPQGVDITIKPGFEDVEIEGKKKTAVKLIVIAS
ncbi:MAG TPA: stage V sporulation protein S [Thermodesulfovibrio thiophilus]|nr:stage V sporulation protein S [Thermodesulfovibrio thiophilus]